MLLWFGCLLFQQSKNGSVTAVIWGALPQPRCDRQKDRVETNPEQLTAASVQAEISFALVLMCSMLKIIISTSSSIGYAAL